MYRLVLLLALAATACSAGAPVARKDVEYGRAGGKTLLLDLHVRQEGPLI
jgi:hypothetical protein